MFKYYLNLNNDLAYKGCYELHRKTCPIVQQLLGSVDDQLLDLGYYDTTSKAIEGAKNALAERGLEPSLLNGCLACNKAYHRR